MSAVDIDPKFDIILISFMICFAWYNFFLEVDSRRTTALSDLSVSKEKGKKNLSRLTAITKKAISFWTGPQNCCENEQLTFYYGGRSAVLLRGHEDATERGTSSWKQHYWYFLGFFFSFPTNSGKCRGVSKEGNCGCKERWLFQTDRSISKHSDPQEKLCYFLPAINDITIIPNKKDCIL